MAGTAPVNADADNDANPDGNSDILAAMQAVAAMMSGRRGTDRSSVPEADARHPVMPCWSMKTILLALESLAKTRF